MTDAPSLANACAIAKPMPAVDGATGIERRAIDVGVIGGSAVKTRATPLAARCDRIGRRKCHSKGGGGNDSDN